MPEDIRRNTLLVISDTPVQKKNGQVKVFEPVLRELVALTRLFDEIIWLGCDAGDGKYILQECTHPKIKVVVMPSVSHPRFNWLYSAINYPVFLFYILKHIGMAKYIHARGPSHPALLAVLISRFDNKRQYWHKYAGNWAGTKVPLTYALQKMLLKKETKNSKVTINGIWDDIHSRLYSFENPCFSGAELQDALKVAETKNFDGQLSLLFVGNLNISKGILNLLEVLKDTNFHSRITRCYIIGNGALYNEVKKLAQDIKHMQVIVTGTLDRDTLNQYYAKAHFLVLPSDSEGFPKVIAEAAAYGCIPVVTGLSAIPQYIQTGVNGYLMNNNEPESIWLALDSLLREHDLSLLSKNATLMCSKFTYEYYVQRVSNELYHF